MYVGLKQPRGDGERYVTPARAAAKETRVNLASCALLGTTRLPGSTLFWLSKAKYDHNTDKISEL